jgi:hypothetical protein
VGLVWWVAAWAFGLKSFDAFMLTVLIVVSAAAWVMLKPFLDNLLGRGEAASEDPAGGVQ